MKTKLFFLGTMMAFGLLNINAQKGIEDGSKYGHGEDSVRCIRRLSLYREYARQNLYENAMPFWRTVFNECPKASKNIYIDGAKIFKYKIENTKDEKAKEKYIDTLLMVYDQRIKYYNDEGNVLGRKGISIMNYRGGDIEAIKNAYDCFDRSIDLEGTKSMGPVLAAYMTASAALYQSDKLSQEDVINDYMRVSDIIDQKLAKKPNSRRTTMIQEMVDKSFSGCGAASCEDLLELFEPKYQESPDNTDLLKKISKILKDNDCTESTLYFNVAEKLHNTAPTAESAYDLAMLAKDHNEYEKTKKYLLEAIDLEADNKEKAKYYVQLGDIVHRELNNPVEARNYAREAIKITDSFGKPYMLIGNIYASTDNCNSNDLDKKAIYWLAVDYYQKAKSIDPSVTEDANKNIKTFSKYFPDKETIFFHGLKIGGTYTVGCWINESTKVRAKN